MGTVKKTRPEKPPGAAHLTSEGVRVAHGHARDEVQGAEKVPIQALDQMQPETAYEQGLGRTMTHDYKRNVTTTLVAAPQRATGEVNRRGSSPPSP